MSVDAGVMKNKMAATIAKMPIAAATRFTRDRYCVLVTDVPLVPPSRSIAVG
jgi:hypothetical protein